MDEIQKEFTKIVEQEILKNLMMINIFQTNISENNILNQQWTEEIQRLEQENNRIIKKYSVISKMEITENE